jgi:type I restriction enzyme S subunit
LITVKGSGTGKTIISDDGYCISRQLMSIRTEKKLTNFVYYYLKEKEKIYNSVSVGLIPGITRNDVNNSLIGLPNTRTETVKIGHVISIWDKAIELKEKLIKQKKEQKKGIIQNLLTGKIRWNDAEKYSINEIKQRVEMINRGEVTDGYKKTKVGIVPKDWDIKKINEVTEYVDYRGKTPKKVTEGIFLITAKNIKEGYIDYKVSQEFVSEKEYKQIMRRGIPKIGDVLFTTEAPLGNVAQVDNENIALAQRVIKFRGIRELSNDFLKYYLLSYTFQSNLKNKAIGTTVLGIQGKQLHRMSIILPSQDEQQKIAQILSTATLEITLLQQQLEELKQQKKGLMQLLLTGKVRVKI